MYLQQSLFFMLFGSFVIQFFIMSTLMTNKLLNIRSTIGKFYISCIMALLMGLLEIGMYDFYMKSLSIPYYFSLIFALIIFVYLYRNQVYIYDKDYLNEMIEHHSMALLTSEEILKKTNDYNIAKVAKNIIQTQNDEIRAMRELLKK